ncbi:MAG: nicotinate (nicotinamide) nucleotide adenylyltransferase [Thermoanaerobaculia bacterium]
MSGVRIAVCGGSFDPIHRGHVEPLLSIFDAMEWSRALYVPAARQPFKRGGAVASARDRWAMAALATDDDPRLALSDIELERGAVSYTIDTLEQLGSLYSDAAFDWIVGDDNLALLPEWKAIDRIFERANFVVLRRGSGIVPDGLLARIAPAEDRPRAGAIALVDNVALPISATEIRRRAGAGEAFEDLVVPPVARYIRKYGLYGYEEAK